MAVYIGQGIATLLGWCQVEKRFAFKLIAFIYASVDVIWLVKKMFL